MLFESYIQKTNASKYSIIIILGLISVIGTISLYQSSLSRSQLTLLELEESEFQAFLSTFSKSYSSESEYINRFKIFRDNKAYIKLTNLMNGEAVLGINYFTDLTVAEFKENFLANHIPENNLGISANNEQIKAPASVNWVAKGAVTPVVDQGQCGGPEVFAAVDSISSAWFLAGHSLITLSYGQVIDCALKGCSLQGSVSQIYNYVIKNGGITSSAIYPVRNSGTCNSSKASQVVAKITSYVNVPASDLNSLQNAVALQPVTVYVDATNWQFYSSGTITSNCGTSLNHVALITGYQTVSSPSYWTLKNSWGVSWECKVTFKSQ